MYDISQNDNHWMCQCPDCRAMSGRESSESGPVVDFIHWYTVGRFAVTNGTLLWAHWTWLLSVPRDRVYNSAEPNHERDIWVSLKVTGPAYVRDSKQPNAVSIDGVIVMKAK